VNSSNWFVLRQPSRRTLTATAPCLNMAGLSQNELKAIRAHPLRKGLEAFRTTFKSRYLKSEDVNLTEIVDQLTSQVSDTGEGTTHEFTSLLIGDRRDRYHT